MKKIITILSVSLIFLSSFNKVSAKSENTKSSKDTTTIKTTHKNIVTFAPLGLINKLRFKYEYSINDNFSTGMVASYYYGLFPGPQIEPFFRYYFGSEAPSGIFLQFKVVFAYQEYIFSDTPANNFYFISGGGGLSIGYQKITGKNKNFPIEFSVGFKAVNPPTNNGMANVATGVYLLTGPGSIFDGTFAVGFEF